MSNRSPLDAAHVALLAAASGLADLDSAKEHLSSAADLLLDVDEWQAGASYGRVTAALGFLSRCPAHMVDTLGRDLILDAAEQLDFSRSYLGLN
jgi:hypothetical protein